MTFSTMKNGAFERVFQRAFQELMDDVMDPDKLTACKRTLMLKFELIPNGREGGRLKMLDPVLKLAPALDPVQMKLRLGFEGGAASAREVNSEEDGHRAIFDHDGNPTDDVRTQ